MSAPTSMPPPFPGAVQQVGDAERDDLENKLCYGISISNCELRNCYCVNCDISRCAIFGGAFHLCKFNKVDFNKKDEDTTAPGPMPPMCVIQCEIKNADCFRTTFTSTRIQKADLYECGAGGCFIREADLYRLQDMGYNDIDEADHKHSLPY